MKTILLTAGITAALLVYIAWLILSCPKPPKECAGDMHPSAKLECWKEHGYTR